ncbi:MAG: hypothetical protein AAF264_04325, partial [Pseudomonadota bacterium]
GFLLAPAMVIWRMPPGLGRVALALATLGPLPLTLVGDTFLRLDLYLYTQCMVVALALAASAAPPDRASNGAGGRPI